MNETMRTYEREEILALEGIIIHDIDTKGNIILIVDELLNQKERGEEYYTKFILCDHALAQTREHAKKEYIIFPKEIITQYQMFIEYLEKKLYEDKKLNTISIEEKNVLKNIKSQSKDLIKRAEVVTDMSYAEWYTALETLTTFAYKHLFNAKDAFNEISVATHALYYWMLGEKTNVWTFNSDIHTIIGGTIEFLNAHNVPLPETPINCIYPYTRNLQMNDEKKVAMYKQLYGSNTTNWLFAYQITTPELPEQFTHEKFIVHKQEYIAQASPLIQKILEEKVLHPQKTITGIDYTLTDKDVFNRQLIEAKRTLKKLERVYR